MKLIDVLATLKPEGWLQIQEMDLRLDRPDITPAMRDFNHTLDAMLQKLGCGGNYASTLHGAFQATGFKNITVKEFLLPIGKLLGDDAAARQSLESFVVTIPSIVEAVRGM